MCAVQSFRALQCNPAEAKGGLLSSLAAHPFPLPVLLQGSRAGVDRLRSRGRKDQDGQRGSLPPVHDHLHWSLLLQLQRRGHMQSCRPALEQVNMTVGRDAQEDRNTGPGCVFNKRNQCVLCKYHFDNISLIQKCLCSLILALSLCIDWAVPE